MVEFKSAADRRFHAQTTACPNCGPQLEFVDSTDGQVVSGSAAIERAAEAVRNGRILALKGIGGYQLVCDATSSTAVGTLRKRKHRPRKPLAVMVGSVEEAAVYATLTDFDKSALTSPANPIVLLPVRVGTSLCDLIHPALQMVGMMLPTSPLHLWLLKLCGLPCVVTSGNVGGDPLVFRNEQASAELSGVADAWLHHNRDIIRPIDDSVVRCIDREQVTIRAARGIAPLSLALPNAPELLATGGNQKVAIALSNGHQAVLGPHIGDLNSLATRQRFIESVHQFSELYRLQPTAIAHDSHPDFFTTGWAASQTVPTISVQHHHAHVAAGMLEHGWLDREVLGVAFDGTGYGTDGTIWGGEFLLSTTMAFRRVAYFRTFPLPGGDRAIREPWRIALPLIVEACGVDKAKNVLAWIRYADAFEPVAQYLGRTRLGHCKLQVATPAERSHTQNGLFPVTSSVGRLFDGVASLLFQLEEASFEGEAAMRLEAVCDPNAVGEYEIPIIGTEPAFLDWRLMIREIVRDMQAKAPTSEIATKFTRSVARSVSTICGRFPKHPVVLTGGCFQNQLLTELTAAMLAEHSAAVGLPGRIPINDGGLAAGQLVIAAATRQSAAAQ
jgi:hydrogenase maturation protein HypF